MSPAEDGIAPARTFAALAFLLALLLVPSRTMAGIVALSGHVTSHLTGAPLAAVRVSIDVLASPFGGEIEIGAAFTDADGLYEWTGDCESVIGVCDVIVDQPPYLRANETFDQNQTVAVVDFALLTPAAASGTVRFPGGDTSGMYVTAERFFDDVGIWSVVAAGDVAEDGRFLIGALAPDTYRFCTSYTQNGAIRQCFDHLDMPPLAGDPDATLVDVPEGSAIDAIDFDLVYGGTLSGTVYDGYLGAPLTATPVQVAAYDVDGADFLYAETDATGTFHLRGLPDGLFYLGINVGGPYADGVQFYPGIVCGETSCPPPTSGTQFAISGGNEIVGLDFTAHPQVVVKGRVLDADSGDGLGGIDVGLYDYDGARLTASDAGTGDYFFYWYADKTFQVGAFGAPPHVDSVYPGAACLRSMCVGDITPLTAATGSVLTAIDIPMTLGATLSGHLMRADNGLPGDAYIELYDSAFDLIWDGYSADSTYTTDPWLPGTYYVEAVGGWELGGCAFYDDRPCPEDDGDPASVDPTPVTVAAGEIRTGIDFRLPPVDAMFGDGFDFF